MIVKNVSLGIKVVLMVVTILTWVYILRKMNKIMIKTSVIVPIYNTEIYLKECIESVLNQTQKEIELILVDDGSTDNSKEIIDEYAKKYSNVIAFHQTNKKQGAARNAGLNVAKGQYVYFLDSDDTISEYLLEQCYEMTKKNNLDFLMFDAKTYVEKGFGLNIHQDSYNRANIGILDRIFNGKEYWKDYYNRGGILLNPVLLYTSREFLLNNNISFLENIYYEDNVWVLNLLMKAKKIMYFPYQGYNRRYRPNSTMTMEYNNDHLNSCYQIIWYLLWLYYEEDSYSKKMIMKVFLMMITRLECICRYMILANNQDFFIVSFERFVKRIFQISVGERNGDTEIIFYLQRCAINIGKIARDADVIVHCSSNLNYLNKVSKEHVKNYYKLNQNLRIGIYGTGKQCDKIIDWHKENETPINAQLYFITTEGSINKYRGYNVYSIDKLEELHLDQLIITSIRYKDDMVNNIKKYNTENIDVIVSFEFL